MGTSKGRALVCMAPFKGYLTNLQATHIVCNALMKLGYEASALPIGDGGAGTFYSANIPGEFLEIPTTNPLGKPISSKVLCVPDSRKPETVFIESSQSCGYTLIAENERNIVEATSAGLGKVLRSLFERYRHPITIYVGLGDSAIADAGTGMLSQLGFEFLDSQGKPLIGNAQNLEKIVSLKSQPLIPKSVTLNILCDVENPLCGNGGSARVFAPQKGASPEQVEAIERGMQNFAHVVKRDVGIDVAFLPRTGSAGGLSGAFLVLGAVLLKGADTALALVNFKERLKTADFVITGEGKTDSQSLRGKAPIECLKQAAEAGRKSYLISGILQLDKQSLSLPGLQGIWGCGKEPTAEIALGKTVSDIFGRT